MVGVLSVHKLFAFPTAVDNLLRVSLSSLFFFLLLVLFECMYSRNAVLRFAIRGCRIDSESVNQSGLGFGFCLLRASVPFLSCFVSAATGVPFLSSEEWFTGWS